MSDRQLKLGGAPVDVGGPGQQNTRLSPEIPGDASVNIEWYIGRARQLEAVGLDFIFIVDSQFITAHSPPHYLNLLEPLTLLSALVVSTTNRDSGTAGDYSREKHYDHARRYGRELEHVAVARGLLDSYNDEALPRDKEAGPFFDPSRQHALNLREGNFAGSAQGGTPGFSSNHRAIVRAAANGREPGEVPIMPGLTVRVADTNEEAIRPQEQIHPAKDFANTLAELGRAFGRLDFSRYDLDAPFPAEAVKYGQNSVRTQAEKIARVAREENLSLRETVLYFERWILNRWPAPPRPSPTTRARSYPCRHHRGRAADRTARSGPR
jgi:alkanesulfonate monooxygenase SsuD/methylene tetrahydromethanopterin reductase-like flavin-dependent oxidoreductase (luciferase family)